MIRFLVKGLKARGRRIHLKTSLVVRGPGGAMVLRRPESTALDRTVPPGKSTSVIEAAVKLDLSVASPTGAYEATLSLLDALGGARAHAKTSFTVVGPPERPARELTLRRFRAPPDVDLLAGLPIHVAFTVAGFTAVRVASGSVPPGAPGAPAGPPWRAHLTATAVLQDGSGVQRASAERTLLHQRLPFEPKSLPVSWAIPLPATLSQGSYHLRVTVRDALGGKSASVVHRFRLLPGGLGIYGLRTVGSGNLQREHFLRGERVTAAMSIRGWASPASVAVDVGLVGPDGGFYLVRKNAHEITGRGADGAKGRALRIPFTIPRFAPTGQWTLKLRLRDRTGKASASRRLYFKVTGDRIRPLPSLQITGLVIRRWPWGPPVPGIFWHAGKTLYFDAVVGGMRLKQEQGFYHRARLTCTLRLRRGGKLVATRKKACTLDRRFSFVPLRLSLHMKWTIPSHLAGKHTFQLEVMDRLSERVSVLQRGCFILIPKAGR